MHKGDPCIYCGIPHNDVPIGRCGGRAFASQILDEVEEIHHWAILKGDLAVMEKIGTLLNKYAEVRKDEVGD